MSVFYYFGGLGLLVYCYFGLGLYWHFCGFRPKNLVSSVGAIPRLDSEQLPSFPDIESFTSASEKDRLVEVLGFAEER